LMGRFAFIAGVGEPFFFSTTLAMNRLSPAAVTGASSVVLDEPIRGLLAFVAYIAACLAAFCGLAAASFFPAECLFLIGSGCRNSFALIAAELGNCKDERSLVNQNPAA
jgi:hypothetical protein